MGWNKTSVAMTGTSSKQSGPFGSRRLLFHLKSGIRYRIPICCVAHFCWDNMLGRAAGMARWKQIANDRSAEPFVPCGFWHTGHSPLSSIERVRQLLKFEYLCLLPTQRGRARRKIAAGGSRLYRNSSERERHESQEQDGLELLWWGDKDLPDLFGWMVR